MEVVSHSFNRNHQPPSAVPGRFTTYMSNNSDAQHTNFGSYSQSSSIRSSDSTNATSSSTLFNIPTPTQSTIGTPMPPTESVLNKRGDKEASLFQISINTTQRLKGLPGFREALEQEAEDAAFDNADPVTVLWRYFRRGYPLMELYNLTGPRVLLTVDTNKVAEKKRTQAATFKFITACMSELGINECFMILDLYGDDTTGFVKVTRVVNKVLDLLVKQGKLDSAYGQNSAMNGDLAGVKKTRRQHIVNELVTTERTYVEHLDLLHSFKKLVEQKGVISGDAIHDIFFNLHPLLDFQRRFLIRVEQLNLMPEEEQNWGHLFVLYQTAFKVYEQYIANQSKSERVAFREFDKLRQIQAPPELQQFTNDPTVLSAFLLKPFQRLAKYPLLLRELRDKGDLSPEKRQEVEEGIVAANSVLESTNAAVDKQERLEAMYELNDRVEDWKGHQLQSFGELLLHGSYQVIKGDSSNPKEQEREYKMYLFEMILLCCKEMNVNKQKNKVLGKQLIDKKGRARLQLKGRIFMQNVTDTVLSTKPGSYSLQIFWKGDPGVESFTIKFNQEDIMRKWADQVNNQRKIWRDSMRISQRTETNDNEFHYMQGQQLVNPYQQDEEEDDDLDGSTMVGYPSGHTYSEYPISRNESQTSLRSRSTTGDSVPPMGMGRMAPRQFPMGAHAPLLQVRTNPMPGEMMHEQSFFSPVSESPISTRSSGTQSIYGAYRQNGLPIPGWSSMDDHRFTAPAMPRQQINSFQSTSRVPQQRPSLPPSAHSTNTVNRMRSASSPDIANPLRRHDQVPPLPDLPSFPNNYAYAPGILPRSQSSSPAQGMTTLPMRTSTQSPQVQQLRMQQTYPRTTPAQGHASEYMPGQQLPRQYSTMDNRYTQEIRLPTGLPSHQPMLGTPASLVPGYAVQHEATLSQINSPPPASTPTPSQAQSQATPTQLKVRVHCESAGSSMVLVVPTTISFQTLKDRIDAKLQRTTNLSLSSGHVKLKYKDEGDLVSVLSDEDVQMAFETWRDSQRGVSGLGIGEVELYIQ